MPFRSKFSINTNEIKARLNKFFDDTTVRKVQSEVVDGEIKRQIAAGLSPVRGKVRFQGYKNPKQYPGNKKPKRPANLFLTGKMLAQYIVQKISGRTLRFGISEGAGQLEKDKSKYNNEGTKNIAARRHIPLKGEEYNVSVMRKIRDIVAKRFKQLMEG